MIALWSSKSKLVPDVKSFYIYIYIHTYFIFLTHCEWCYSVGLMIWIFKLGFFWSSSGSPPTASFKKLLCLAWMAKTCVEEEDFFVVYIFIFRIMVERLDWGLGFPPVEMFVRMIVIWIKGDLLAVLWLWFSTGSSTNNEKAIVSPSPTFILGINEWLRSLCSKIIAHGFYRKNENP